MAGPDHRKERESIRKAITTTDPTIVDRVLGVHYTLYRSDNEVRVTMDMCDYMKQALDMRPAVQDAPPLRNGVHYTWYEPTVNDINTLSNEPGIFAHCSLSRFVTKWNNLCDKQLTHLFSYLLQTQKTALRGYFGGNDIHEVELHAFPDADLAGSYDTSKATSGGLSTSMVVTHIFL